MMLVPDTSGRWTPTPVTPGKETEPGLIVYRFGADLSYANHNRFTYEVRTLAEHAPTSVHWSRGAISMRQAAVRVSLRDPQ